MLIFSAVVEVAWWQRIRLIGCHHTPSWDHIRQRIITPQLKHSRVSLTFHWLPKLHHSSTHATPLYWLRSYFHQWKDLVLLIGQYRQQSSSYISDDPMCFTSIIYIIFSHCIICAISHVSYHICSSVLTLLVFSVKYMLVVVVCFTFSAIRGFSRTFRVVFKCKTW